MKLIRRIKVKFSTTKSHPGELNQWSIIFRSFPQKNFFRWLLRDYKVISHESSTNTVKLVSMDFLWMCNSMAVEANATWRLAVPFSNSGLHAETAEPDTSYLHRNKMHIVLRVASALSQHVLSELYRVAPNSCCFLEAQLPRLWLTPFWTCAQPQLWHDSTWP